MTVNGLATTPEVSTAGDLPSTVPQAATMATTATTMVAVATGAGENASWLIETQEIYQGLTSLHIKLR